MSEKLTDILLNTARIAVFAFIVYRCWVFYSDIENYFEVCTPSGARSVNILPSTDGLWVSFAGFAKENDDIIWFGEALTATTNVYPVTIRNDVKFIQRAYSGRITNRQWGPW